MRTSIIYPKPTRKHIMSKGPSKKLGTVTVVVRGQIRNTKSKAAAAQLSAGKLIEAIRTGLPVEELEALRRGLDIPMDKLAPKLGISKATLYRRKLQGRLGPEESDRILRFARLMGKAVEVLEDEDAARRWLRSPQVGLGGATPLDYAETEVGAREVEDLLGRIEYGVYS
jgi:putative toxin-antitoxin system antitoxin component (TIGR02293 family)